MLKHGRRLCRWEMSGPSGASLAVVVMVAVMLLPQAAFASLFVVGNCQGGGGFSTIQEAVDAAIARSIMTPGTTERIEICPGTYNENVVVDAPDPFTAIMKGLGSNKRAVRIRGLAGTVGPIVYVKNATDFTLENLTVDGRSHLESPAPSGPTAPIPDPVVGVKYYRSGGTIQDITIQNIRNGDGSAPGNALWIQGEKLGDFDPMNPPDPWTVIISSVMINNTTRNAITCDGYGPICIAADNMIVAPRSAPVWAPNGMQCSRGAICDFQRNEIDGPESPTPAIGAGSGIIIFCANDGYYEDNITNAADFGMTIGDAHRNILLSNDVALAKFGIVIQSIGLGLGNDPECTSPQSPPSGNLVDINTINSSTMAGIDVNTIADPMFGDPHDNDVNRNRINGYGIVGLLARSGSNRFDSNRIVGGTADITDLTTGMGTAGTASTYTLNQCLVSDPAGLCTAFLDLARLASASSSVSGALALSHMQQEIGGGLPPTPSMFLP